LNPALPIAVEEELGRIADEFLNRLQRGESPTVEEYVAANPELTDVLRNVLPLVRASHSTDPSAPDPSRMPERLGEFCIVRELGRGGMGVVYEAMQEPLGRRVALKVLPAAVQLQPHYLERFRREAQAAARLHHTNIVPIYSVGEATGIHFIVMQFIDGTGLDQAHSLQRGTIRDVARIGLEVAEALAHAHAAGVLHRDIKPSNLLLDTGGAVWVTDFGLAKLVDGDDITGSGDFLGTLRYAAPERLSGSGDERSDVYSLGATLYELLTGKRAFDAAARDRLVRQITQDEPARPRRIDPAIPLDLETIVIKALAKSPARRYASAGEMADDLRRFLDGRPVTARRATLVEQIWRWCRRRPAVAGLLALSMTALLALLIVSLVANARLSTALTQVGAERDRAEANAVAEKQAREAALVNLRRARQAVDRMLAKVGAVKLQGVPLVEKVRRDLLEDALKLSQEFLVENPSDPELRWETAMAYLRVGSLRHLLGDHDAAAAANQKGIELMTQLRAEFPDAPAYEHDLAKHFNNLAQQLRAAGRMREAEDSFRKAISINERLTVAFPDNLNYRLDLAMHHNNLGNVLHTVGRVSDAQDEFRRAAAEANRLLALKRAEPRYRMELAYAELGLGSALGAEGRVSDAEPVLKRAVDQLRQLTKDAPNAPQHFRELVQATRTLGYLFQTTNRADVAETAYREAIDVGERLAADFPDAAEYRQALARAWSALGSVLYQAARWSDSEAAFSRAVTLGEKLVADAPTAHNLRQDLSNVFVNLSLVFQRTGRMREAEEATQRALSIKEKLAGEFPTIPAYQSDFGGALNNLATFLRDRKEYVEARRLADKAIQQQQTALRVEPKNPKYQEFLGKHYQTLASIQLESGEAAAAGQTAQKALGIRPKSADDAIALADIAVASARRTAENANLSDGERAARTAACHDLAMKVLHEAVRRGFRDAKRLQNDPDLEPLRAREDFLKLVSEMAAGGPPASNP
jgi:tetratricopeptide (TPR) repeat protein/predicted Ser/Thr protein kinase